MFGINLLPIKGTSPSGNVYDYVFQDNMVKLYKNGVLLESTSSFIELTLSCSDIGFSISSNDKDFGYFFPTGSSLIGIEQDVINTGVTGIPNIVDDVIYDWANTGTGARDIYIPMEPAADGLTGDISIADDEYVVPDAVYTGAVELDYADVIGADLAGVPVLESDYTGSADDAVNDTQTADDAMATDETESSLKGLVYTAFPFCLPWDLMNAIKLIAVQPEAPHFKIDIFEKLPFEFKGSTEIKFDMAEYPQLGAVSRWTSTIGFCIALIVLTRKIIKS